MNFLEKLIEKDWHIRILEILLVIAASYLIYKLIAKILSRHESRIGAKKELEPRRRTYYRMAFSALRYVVAFVALLLILEIAGINISSLVAGLGIASIVVGLALQDWLKDIIRGASLIGESYFHVGDVIVYKGREGEVLAAGLKTTRIRLLDSDNILSVANRNLEEIEVVSWIYREKVPMPYDLPVYQSEKVVKDIVARVEKNENVESCRYVGVTDLGTSAIQYFLEIRSNPLYRKQVRRDTLRSILLGLEKYQIPVPYTQMDIHAVNEAERAEIFGAIASTPALREYAEKNSRSSSDSIFRTEKYRVNFTGSNEKEVLDGAEYFVSRMGCSKKEVLRIRLLIEEMMELMKTVTPESWITVVIDVRNRTCVVRAEMSAGLDASQRKSLERLSAIGGVPAGSTTGLITRMRNVVAHLISTGSGKETRVWSMKEYIDTVKQNDRLDNGEEQKIAREEIEHSIIAKLADDVRVSFSEDSIVAEATRSIQS